MEFNNLDGFLSEKGDKLYDTSNRSMRYGDGIFETIKLVNGELMFWKDHYNRLFKGMKHLKLDTIGKEEDFWKKEVEKVIVKNYFTNARIRIIVYRNSPGTYTPMGNRVGFLIEGTRFDKPNYMYSKEGLRLGLFEGDHKGMSPMNNLKTTSALLFVLAGVHKKETEVDDVVVLNAAGRVCETVSSNIFAVIDNKVITPKLSEGCLDGVMRKQIIKAIKQKEIDFEEGELTLEKLRSANEIFTTNSMAGVQGIGEFEGKSKDLSFVKELQSYLDSALQQVQKIKN